MKRPSCTKSLRLTLLISLELIHMCVSAWRSSWMKLNSRSKVTNWKHDQFGRISLWRWMKKRTWLYSLNFGFKVEQKFANSDNISPLLDKNIGEFANFSHRHSKILFATSREIGENIRQLATLLTGKIYNLNFIMVSTLLNLEKSPSSWSWRCLRHTELGEGCGHIVSGYWGERNNLDPPCSPVNFCLYVGKKPYSPKRDKWGPMNLGESLCRLKTAQRAWGSKWATTVTI